MSKKINRSGTLFCIFLLLALACGIRSYSGAKTSLKIPQNSSPLTMSALGLSTNPSSTDSSYEILPEETANNSSKPVSVSEHLAVPILYYHSVMLEFGNEVRMPPDQFEAQMAYLQGKGYHSVSLDQLYQAQYRGGALPTKPFVITFDDGYADNYTTAYPVLKRHGFTATVFMVSSYINGEGFMSWPQLKELAANGWEIEGHTVNHHYLSKQNVTTVLNELRSSKELLERELGRPVEFFAYPFGDFNPAVAQAVRNTGYLMAVTTERGWANHDTDSWHVHRVYCYANMGLNEFSRRLQNPNY